MKKSIKERIILRVKKINPKEELYSESNYDKPLTGKLFGFSGRELAYLMLELIDEFDITFMPEDLLNYRFNTINSIASLIEQKVSL